MEAASRRLPYWTTKTRCPTFYLFSPSSTLDIPNSLTEHTGRTEGEAPGARKLGVGR